MGGKKKLGIKQMEKQQVKTDEDKAKEAKKKEKAGPPKERKTVGIMVPDAKDGKNISEIKKMGVLTPYAVSTRYGITDKRSQRLSRTTRGKRNSTTRFWQPQHQNLQACSITAQIYLYLKTIFLKLEFAVFEFS